MIDPGGRPIRGGRLRRYLRSRVRPSGCRARRGAGRIDTIIAYDAAAEVGAKTDGSVAATSADVLAEMADLVASGRIVVPIAATYPLEKVADAYAEVEQRHTLGKVVLLP